MYRETQKESRLWLPCQSRVFERKTKSPSTIAPKGFSWKDIRVNEFEAPPTGLSTAVDS
jgi:hypothetical protein